VLLRVNIDYVPRGMNPGTATGSRRSVFGMDWQGEELIAAVNTCLRDVQLQFLGLHMHVGSGIRQAVDYARACARLCETAERVARLTSASIDYLDVGGGFGSPMVSEYSTLAFLGYHAAHRLPRSPSRASAASFDDFARAISTSIVQNCNRLGLPLPTLVLEPGRCLTGPNQLLLLRVLRTKSRQKLRPWIITDGGQMTVNFPTFYEYHAMFRCRQPFEAAGGAVDIIGPGCHAADVVSRDRRLPPLGAGDVLAIMDAGAYFLSFEGNFGFPRAAVVGIEGGRVALLRRRERYEDMLAREFQREEAYA
jgi:diaminopimelate decarboxylase